MHKIVWILGCLLIFGASAQTRQPQCFACRMRVLTPSGYVPLGHIQAGDHVLSWDVRRRELVQNLVRDVHLDQDGLYGDLVTEGSALTIEVTSDHPFYMPELLVYRPIVDIAPDEKLLAVHLENGRCSEFLVERGEYAKGGIGPVKTLILESPPNNFVVEGVVVHN